MSSSPELGTTESEYTCRICLEDGQRSDFIAPCACAGSARWVHRDCLNKWRSMREDKAFSRCTECLKPYEMVCRSDNNDEMTHSRRCRFVSLIARDFSIVLAISQLCIVIFGSIVYGFDHYSHPLISALHMSSRPALFYYLAGLFFTLSFLGMAFTVVQIGCCGERNGSCSHCHHNGCNNYVCIDVYYPCVYSNPHAAVCECGVCPACLHGECCACCADTGTAGAGCGECAAGASVGEECVMCMIVVVVIFAVVGVFVCVVVGAAYAQSIVRTHYHVLQKYTLATDFIVADLAEGALPIDGSSGKNSGGGVDRRDVNTVAQVTEPGTSSGGWWIRSSNRSREGYARAPTSEEGEVQMDVEAGAGGRHSVGRHTLHSAGTIELLPLPSAPAMPTAAHSSMDRHSPASISNTGALNNSPDASAPLIQANSANNSGSPILTSPPPPYNPVTHHFSRTQYQELLTRGLL